MEKQPLKGLSYKGQCCILAIGAATLAVVLILVPVLHNLLAKPAPALPKLVQSGFHPDSTQWANITLGTVTARKLPGLVSVGAQVATDDGTTAQVFSPFTPRVATIDVRVGDHVAKDAVLTTVTASEAMRSGSDMIAVAAARRRSPLLGLYEEAMFKPGSSDV